MNKGRLFSLIILFLALSACASPLTAAPGIRVRGSAVQGGLLFATIESVPADTAGTVLWMGLKIPLSPGGSGLQAVLPVRVDARPGAYYLKVILEGPPASFMQRKVTIGKKRFATQSLWLSADQLSSYDYPGVEREYEEIHGAFRKFSGLQAWEGPFLVPADGPVVTSFGLRRYVNGEDYGEHRGQDVAAGQGEPVRASNSGTVTLVREDYRLHGKTVIVDHGQGISSIYMHLSFISVREKDSVGRGAIIGKVGSTGVATGPHLHWGIYVHGEAVNPASLLNPPREWLPGEAP